MKELIRIEFQAYFELSLFLQFISLFAFAMLSFFWLTFDNFQSAFMYAFNNSWKCIIDTMFSFHRNVIFPYWGIQLFETTASTFENCDVVMSSRTRGRVHFQISLLNCKSFELEHGQIMDKVMGTIFRKFYLVWKLGFKSKSFVIYQLIVMNEKPIMISLWFITLLKVRTETIN